jgi:hypothetical protein
MRYPTLMLAALVLAGCAQPELVALGSEQMCQVNITADKLCPKDKVVPKSDVMRVVEHLVIDKKAQTLQPAAK